MSVEVKEHLAHRVTDFQVIDVYDTFAFGRTLFLDGHVQLAELDERAYHESLVHIPLLNVESPRRALVVGGGDGGVLRELVKHTSILTIDMVEIDRGVVEVCRETLPFVSGGAFGDPRVNLHIADAFEFIKSSQGSYDLMIMDVTDVYEGEDGALSEQLFTSEFHRDCAALLTDGGFLVTQADNHIFCPYSLEGVLSDFRAVFPNVGSYQALVPSFGGYSAFAWASRSGSIGSTFPERRAKGLDLSYLSATTYDLAMLSLPFHLDK